MVVMSMTTATMTTMMTISRKRKSDKNDYDIDFIVTRFTKHDIVLLV